MFCLPTGLSRFFIVFLMSVVLCGAGTAHVWASKVNLKQVSLFEDARLGAPLYIPMGKAELVDIDGQVSDVLVADPSVVDVIAVQSNRLYVVGLSVGDTNLIVLDRGGNIVKRLDLHVRYDLRAIQSLVNGLFPKEDVKVDSIHDQILLTGSVSTAEQAARISDIVAHYVGDLIDEDFDRTDEYVANMMEVRGEQQVMLQVRIVEASRTITKELGLEFNTSGANSGLNTNVIARSGAGIALANDPAGTFNLLRDSGLDEIGILDLQLNALEDEGLVNVLAEPNLTAVSGQQAGFLAGGEFPVPTGRDQVGNLTIEFREFGVALNFRPVVLSKDRISLNLNTEVSSLDFANAIVLADVTVPGLDVRRAETTVEVQSGGSLMIAGLLQSSAIKDMAGLPGIRQTPVLGDLMSSDSFQREETELIVLVTPYLVTPFAEQDRAAALPEVAQNPLADLFAANIRRVYALKDDEIEELLDGKNFGYLLD